MPAVNCPNCPEELDVPNELLGRDVRCASCQNVFRASLPNRPEVPVVQRRASVQLEDPENPAMNEERSPRKRTRRGSMAWLFIMLGMLSCCGVGCGGFFVMIGIVANPPFQKYDSPDGTFAAAFPAKPKANNETTEDGQARVSVEARRKFPPEFYYVQHVDITKKEDAEALLKDAADKSVKRVVGGTEIRRTAATVDGYPAIDLMIEHGNGQQVTLVRHVVVGKRLYTLGIVGPHGLDFPIEYVDKFFSGFQIKQKK